MSSKLDLIVTVPLKLALSDVKKVSILDEIDENNRKMEGNAIIQATERWTLLDNNFTVATNFEIVMLIEGPKTRILKAVANSDKFTDQLV